MEAPRRGQISITRVLRSTIPCHTLEARDYTYDAGLTLMTISDTNSQSQALDLCMPIAPNNTPTIFSCTFTGKVGISLGETLLDGIGIIPGANDVVHGVQLTATVVSTGIAVFGDVYGAGFTANGAGLTLADKFLSNPETISSLETGGGAAAEDGFDMIPAAGNIVSGIATIHDLFGVAAAYKTCLAGGS